MLIECLIKRNGPTEVPHEGVKYLFMPRPELTGSDTANVCEVCASHAINRFLAIKDSYREWTGGKPEEKKEDPPRRQPAPAEPPVRKPGRQRAAAAPEPEKKPAMVDKPAVTETQPENIKSGDPLAALADAELF